MALVVRECFTRMDKIKDVFRNADSHSARVLWKNGQAITCNVSAILKNKDSHGKGVRYKMDNVSNCYV